MEEDISVAQQILSMEATSGIKVVSKIKNPKTKIPISMYFEKTTENQVKFMGAYMELYIPSSELEHKNTIISGREVYTYGIFQIKIWNAIPENPVVTPPNYISRYIYPSTFTTIPSNILKRTMSIVGEEEQPCMVLGYHKGDVFIKNTLIAKSSDIVARFVNSINKAFLSPVVRYAEISNLVFECAAINGVDFGVNATVLEVMIAAQARYKKDVSTPYRTF